MIKKKLILFDHMFPAINIDDIMLLSLQLKIFDCDHKQNETDYF